MSVPGFGAPYHDAETDALSVVNRISEDLQSLHCGKVVQKVEVIRGGFYRNRGAYIVGRLVLTDDVVIPFILALLNSEEGIYVDAVLTKESAAHNLFSTTRANFNVTNAQYHEVSEFLYSIMPKRPLGLHYSTIGFNHFGKVAVMDELKSELLSFNRSFSRAIGYPGTVAIGFHSPDSTYNLKVIRNKPTAQYKWGKFEGVDRVLAKYSQVHDINRTGSMLDNIIYYNVKLERQWFGDGLLRELLCEASETVAEQGDSIVFKHLIVQRRMTPLPVYLETASASDCEMAVVNLGHCIKNNTAANIFNRDLDARNYGVGGFMRVYLFDYDALTAFTEVKIRSNKDRYEGEQDVPDWFFEDGVVFLPEEIEWGLRIPSRHLRQLFRGVHGDLLQVDYWEQIQDQLQKGKVPSVRVYPERDQLLRIR
ncbi:MAG: isocitrate dehydrogenase kinase/phosphatase AceK regulatory subunit [Alphaproteobacteria bacterium]